MGKIVVKHFYCDLYKENFYLFLGKPKKMDKRFPMFAPFDSKGRTFHPWEPETYDDDPEYPGCCIYLKNTYDWHILAHEAVHAANWLLRQKGVKINRKNDEALAYYVSWIMEKAMEAIHEDE